MFSPYKLFLSRIIEGYLFIIVELTYDDTMFISEAIMIGKCIWLLKLPFHLAIGKDIDHNTNIIIDETKLSFTKEKNSNFYEFLKVEVEAIIEDDYFSDNGVTTTEFFHFNKQITHYVGERINKFVNAYYRVIDNLYINQLYNGDSIIVPYYFFIYDENKNIKYNLDSMNVARVLDAKSLEKIKSNFSKSEHDIVDELIRYSNTFLENGLFEMSIMHLAMATESFIKTLATSNGIKKQALDSVKGYIDKYFHLGLHILTGKSLKEEQNEYYCILLEINDIRNRIAHGGSMYDLPVLSGKTLEDVYDLIFYYIWNMEDMLDWIKSLPINS